MRVRLTHALGSNEFELSPRGIDDPVILGRASDADLQVPSIEVSRSHAVIFVHDGAWVVQDSGSKDGTSVNGARIEGPTRLSVGDSITLGTGPKAATVKVLSLEATPPPVAVPAEPEIGALDTFQTPVATTPYARRYPRKNQSNNVAIAGIAGAVLIGIGFVGAVVAYIAYTNKVAANEELERQNAAAARQEVIVRKSESERKTIFMDGSASAVTVPDATPKAVSTPGGSTPSPTSPPTAVTVPPPAPVPAPAPSPEPPEPAAVPPEAASDPQWARILEFRDASPPALAMYQYIQYRATNPTADKLAKLDAFQEEAIDLLWWQRVNDLVGQQTQIDGQIQELKKEKASLPSDATKERREQFDKQVKHLESLKSSNNLLLRDEMGFQGDNPVDLGDDSQLKSLREKRDTEAYKRWTGRVISRVQATRGASAW